MSCGTPELLRPNCGLEPTLETRGVSLSIMRWLYEVGVGPAVVVVVAYFGVDVGRSTSSWGIGEPGAVSGVLTALLVPALLGVLAGLCLLFFRLNNLTPIFEERKRGGWLVVIA